MHVGNIYSSELIMKILIDCNMSEYWVDHNRVYRDTSYSCFKHLYKDKLTKMFTVI